MKLLIVAVLVAAASAAKFELKNGTETCIILDVDAKLEIAAKNSSGEVVFARNISVGSTANVTGNCSDDASSNVMTLDFGDDGKWVLVFSKGEPVTLAQMFTFTPKLLSNDTLPDSETVQMAMTEELSLSATNHSYLCNAEQSFKFKDSTSENVTYSLTQVVSNLRVQAYGLKDGNFSEAEECAADSTTIIPQTTVPANTTESPTTEPLTTTTAPSASANTYAVKDGPNRTCIVFKAAITFNNFTYLKEDNTTGTGNNIIIPKINSTEEVTVSGSCGLENATEQWMNITFNGNWTLVLKFRRGPESDSNLLAASNDFSLSEIELTYFLVEDYFPGVRSSDWGKMEKVGQVNITKFQGQVGGSYRCDADVKETLNGGVIFETTDLQYKAFNDNNDPKFSSDKVSECAGDDESNSIVPIAVGAALAGLVVIVLIAYLIGRRRSRRQGYESV